ncbi:winged helix-turn-helix domain-containing protein [Dyella sp.]|uniref:winged helix-turn-helix domain-containing protein n=1 Tax=Dyella sp. TaxID=1869338 RepID=UPI002B463987|nr:crosslink repair DNA glycosylase YcaQ family protein [Dyella sp.]HKT30339.1 crosslink repair DNA glycosylase YcaQ family protein [Dyella sp.]
MQLAAQGLLQAPKRRARRDDLIATIQRMRLLQIDSIHVVARSPYLVLFARLGAYPQAWLEEALEAGRIAECWAHEACFVTAADIGFHRAWRAQAQSSHWADKHAARARDANLQEMHALLERVRTTGAVRASDFERAERAASGWWEWKPEKRWLEAWFASGELMVTRRERFQRVYDLAERVLAKLDPPFDEALLSRSTTELRQHFILDSVRALGITQARWMADYFRLKPAVDEKELAPLLSSGKLLRVQVAGWDSAGYVHHDHASLLDSAYAGRLRATHTTVLSPFDPLVWDRARVRAMFDFDYTIECYVPAAKRRYGYYVLPILHRGRLIGRLDAKAHRAEGRFEIKALFLEEGVTPTDRLLADVADAIAETAAWHGTPDVRLGRCRPASLGPALRAYWR